ncbi:MAG: AI-2E family transporter [Actinomycetes bacterium]
MPDATAESGPAPNPQSLPPAALPEGGAKKKKVTVRFDQSSVRKTTITICIVGAMFLLALWLFSVISHFLFLLMLAWLCAIALEPGIRALVARGRSRGVSTAIMGGGALLTALVLIWVFGQLFFTQIAELVEGAPAIAASLISWVNSTFHTNFDSNSLTSAVNLTPTQIASWAESLSGGVFGVIGSLSSVLFDTVTVLVFGAFLAADMPNFLRAIGGLMPQRAQQIFINVSEITTQKTGGYVISKVILAGLSSVFHAVFFVIIGVPYWLPFALLVGITAQFIPIVGTYIGVLLPVLATVFTSPWKAIGIVIFAAVYQQIETYYFTPRVSKKTMDVNPAIALAAVFVGAAIWGPLGAIIGIPLAAAGVAILTTYQRRYELVPELAGPITEEQPQPSG